MNRLFLRISIESRNKEFPRFGTVTCVNGVTFQSINRDWSASYGAARALRLAVDDCAREKGDQIVLGGIDFQLAAETNRSRGGILSLQDRKSNFLGDGM